MVAELALTKPEPMMERDDLKLLMDQAVRYVASGLLPNEVNTPQKALVVMVAGREMGVPPTYALRNIHVVKGKPVCSAELLLALVRRTYGAGAIRVSATTNTACTVQYREQGWDGISEYTFTIEDARQAGVAGSNTWKSYPAAMLRARCISAVVRFAFPEAIAGLYTPEEMGAEVVITDDGGVQIVDVEPINNVTAIRDAAVPTDDIDARLANNANARASRAKYAQKLIDGTAAAKAIGIDVEELDPADLTDEELRNTVKALGEMVKSTREEIARQAAPAQADDDDAPF